MSPRTRDHYRVEDQPADLELEVERLASARRDRDDLLGGLVPNKLRANRVRPGRNPKGVAPVGVGQNSPRGSARIWI